MPFIPKKPHEIIRAYKHVAPEFADAFANGTSIRVGTFEHYRTGEYARADKLEGRTLAHIPSLTDKQLTPIMQQRLLRNGIFLENVLGLKMIDVGVFHELPPSYLFCASRAPDEDLRREGVRIFEISDLNEFAIRVAPTLSGSYRIGAGPVEYNPREANLLAQDEVRPDPWVKDSAFEWEREVRVVWDPVPSRPLVPVMNVFCPAVTDLIRPA